MKCWAKWDLSDNSVTLRGVPNYESKEALQYLFGVTDGEHVAYWRYKSVCDSIDYVGWCLDHGHFGARFHDECLYLGLTVDAWNPYRDYQSERGGRVEDWSDARRALAEAKEIALC